MQLISFSFVGVFALGNYKNNAFTKAVIFATNNKTQLCILKNL
jgi:hypothetical protein